MDARKKGDMLCLEGTKSSREKLLYLLHRDYGSGIGLKI